MSWFANLKLSQKMSMLIGAILLGIVAIALLTLHQLHAELLDSRKVMVKNLVESSYQILAKYESDVRLGRMSETDAKQAALADIKSQRYGNGDYFWINDLTPAMVMHPIKPELDGKKLDKAKTPDGAYLFNDMVSIVQKDGEGFYAYLWPKPGFEQPVRKVSYIKKFAPWGWIIGSGVYLDDVDKNFREKTILFVLFALTGTLIAIGLSIVVTRAVVRPLNRLTDDMTKMSEGQLNIPILYVNQKDEVGTMSRALNVFREAMEKAQDLSRKQEQCQQEKDKAAQLQSQLAEQFNSKVVDIISVVINSAAGVRKYAEITRNIQQAHTSTSEVATNVAAVRDGTQESNRSIRIVMKEADGLGSQAETMRAIADDFLIQLQSGGGTLEWGPAWVSGHPVIDKDHKMLVQYVNELNHAMLHGAGHDVASDVLNKLVQYTVDHFAREEVIWTQGGLASLDNHKRIHANLVEKVKAFQQDFASGKATLTTELMTFLRQWLINHVFKTDKAGVKEISTKTSDKACA